MLVESSLFEACDADSSVEHPDRTRMKSFHVDFRAFIAADMPVKPRSLAHMTTAERRFTPIFA